ncbi:MAG: peptide-methionine (R)-S-oxide reductase, partial [Chitinophagaceae bacterium]
MESSINNFAAAKKESTTEKFACANCGCILFDADKKFEAGCGFPSFWLHHGNNVKQNPLHTYGRSRIQLLCNDCGAHLGHLFSHKHTPNGLRYCINA